MDCFGSISSPPWLSEPLNPSLPPSNAPLPPSLNISQSLSSIKGQEEDLLVATSTPTSDLQGQAGVGADAPMYTVEHRSSPLITQNYYPVTQIQGNFASAKNDSTTNDYPSNSLNLSRPLLENRISSSGSITINTAKVQDDLDHEHSHENRTFSAALVNGDSHRCEESQDQSKTRKKSKSTQVDSPSKGENKNATFLTKLYEILEAPTNHHMIHWSEDGKQIVIERPLELEAKVLPIAYKQSKFASFSRQLNIYSFMRKMSVRSTDKDSTDGDASFWTHPTLTKWTSEEDVTNYKRRTQGSRIRSQSSLTGATTVTRRSSIGRRGSILGPSPWSAHTSVSDHFPGSPYTPPSQLRQFPVANSPAFTHVQYGSHTATPNRQLVQDPATGNFLWTPVSQSVHRQQTWSSSTETASPHDQIHSQTPVSAIHNGSRQEVAAAWASAFRSHQAMSQYGAMPISAPAAHARFDTDGNKNQLGLMSGNGLPTRDSMATVQPSLTSTYSSSDHQYPGTPASGFPNSGIASLSSQLRNIGKACDPNPSFTDFGSLGLNSSQRSYAGKNYPETPTAVREDAQLEPSAHSPHQPNGLNGLWGANGSFFHNRLFPRYPGISSQQMNGITHRQMSTDGIELATHASLQSNQQHWEQSRRTPAATWIHELQASPFPAPRREVLNQVSGASLNEVGETAGSGWPTNQENSSRYLQTDNAPAAITTQDGGDIHGSLTSVTSGSYRFAHQRHDSGNAKSLGNSQQEGAPSCHIGFKHSVGNVSGSGDGSRQPFWTPNLGPASNPSIPPGEGQIRDRSRFHKERASSGAMSTTTDDMCWAAPSD